MTKLIIRDLISSDGFKKLRYLIKAYVCISQTQSFLKFIIQGRLIRRYNTYTNTAHDIYIYIFIHLWRYQSRLLRNYLANFIFVCSCWKEDFRSRGSLIRIHITHASSTLVCGTKNMS